MKKYLLLLSALSLITCSRDNFKNVIDESAKGSVKLSVNLGNFFIGGSGADSPWNHIYQESADITFSSPTTDYTSTVSFNPNDLSTFPETTLPYDTYSWSITKTGDDVAVSDVLYIYGSSATNFTVDSPTTTVPLVLDTDFALVTVSTENLASASIRYNGTNTDLTTQDGYYFGYINANNTPYILQIVSTDDLAGMDTISDPVAYTHYNYQVTFDTPTTGTIGISLSLSQNFVIEDRDITAEADDDLDGVPNSLDECPDTPSGAIVNQYGCDITNAVYLDENGVTVKAYHWAEVGDTGEINGVIYTIVDNNTVRNSENPETMCTTRVTELDEVFMNMRNFNGNIGSWDVSNVTDMSYLFANTNFNQDLSYWDVSNVANMQGMFEGSSFNSDISNWDVGNVTNMQMLFYGTGIFNQDIGKWDVSNVANMSNMFTISNFNQDISSWDVSNVVDMSRMFFETPFNQDIRNWDVSNVANMEGMFAYTSFNQNISNWNVGSVTDMSGMFRSTVFNQDISNWDVDNVTRCSGFSMETPSWTLPKPNFTNCTE